MRQKFLSTQDCVAIFAMQDVVSSVGRVHDGLRARQLLELMCCGLAVVAMAGRAIDVRPMQFNCDLTTCALDKCAIFCHAMDSYSEGDA
ncbi:hypothetical protein CSC75_09590 [Pseudoxanthomonas wuyuanensis]|nr:hypothetical protein CSC75_09590 [Pseudoxanthomonas wuyuanensis]